MCETMRRLARSSLPSSLSSTSRRETRDRARHRFEPPLWPTRHVPPPPAQGLLSRAEFIAAIASAGAQHSDDDAAGMLSLSDGELHLLLEAQDASMILLCTSGSGDVLMPLHQMDFACGAAHRGLASHQATSNPYHRAVVRMAAPMRPPARSPTRRPCASRACSERSACARSRPTTAARSLTSACCGRTTS